tara:strand:- start:5792 stop:6439 length:648 start_codon:yes stop_codon:yes gene_type:complete
MANQKKINVTYRDINELIPADYNPRQIKKNDYRQLKKSLETFGLVTPILINKHKERNDTIIGGHQRIAVLKDLGHTEVPTIELKLSLEAEQELNIRLNKNGGEFDFDMLANHFDAEWLEELGFKKSELGTTLDEYTEEFYSITDEEAEMPIVQKFNEQYSSVLIFVDNELDMNWLRNVLDLRREVCYKNATIGETHVLGIKKFQRLWEQNQNADE